MPHSAQVAPQIFLAGSYTHLPYRSAVYQQRSISGHARAHSPRSALPYEERNSLAFTIAMLSRQYCRCRIQHDPTSRPITAGILRRRFDACYGRGIKVYRFLAKICSDWNGVSQSTTVGMTYILFVQMSFVCVRWPCVCSSGLHTLAMRYFIELRLHFQFY